MKLSLAGALVLAMLVSGSAEAQKVVEFGRSNILHAVGTASLSVWLPTGARFVTQDEEYLRAQDPSVDWTPVHGRPSHDDLHISSTAEAVSVILEQQDRSKEGGLRLAFVSHRARIGGCQLPECGRYEFDVQWSGPTAETPEGVSGPHIYRLPPGAYTLAVVAPAGARTTAHFEIDLEGDPETAGRVWLNLAPSTRGALRSWSVEDRFARPVAGTLSVRVPTQAKGIASLTRFHRHGQKEDPASPMIELRFMSHLLRSGGGSLSQNAFDRLTTFKDLGQGQATIDWTINTTDVDRRAAAWILVWW